MNPWHALVLVTATAGTALMARALPWPKRWLDMKPLACAACMSGWSAFGVMTLGHHEGWMKGLSVWVWILGWLALLPFSAVVFRMLYPPPVDIRLPGDETSPVES